MLTKIDLIPKKKGCKQNLIRSDGSNDSKIVFTLLTKVVTFYKILKIIDVKKPSFEFIFR